MAIERNKDGVSVLIVNYNGEKYIYETVKTFITEISKYDLNYEILIIDNKSTDNSLLIIRDLKTKYKGLISCIQNNENVGFGKGNNVLAAISKYEKIILLNNDTKIISLKNVFRFIQNKNLRTNHILTSKIYNKNLSIQKNWYTFPKPIMLVLELFIVKFFIKKFFLSTILRKEYLKNDLSDIGFSGCFLVMDKYLYTKLGGFDESFFFYHEECDLFLRAKKFNVQKIILDDFVIHYGGGGSEISNFAFINYYTSLFLLYWKHRIINKNRLLKLFNVSFHLRNFLLHIGIVIPFSPFENHYLNQKNTRSRREIIQLHKDTLKSIAEVSIKPFSNL